MKLLLQRYSDNKESTLGLLFEMGPEKPIFLCYTLEDQFNATKVVGETRIPEGTYILGLRTEGQKTLDYQKQFPSIHKGMLWLKDVPKFEYVYIHIGNDGEDTLGCILVGNLPDNNQIKKGFVGESTAAYLALYEKITKTMARKETVILEVRDENFLS